MSAITMRRGRRWLAPEVVQTSAMDCGPASLKCLLEGFHISVSYGRLREACQTDVDGTSIDTMEVVANELGLKAEQVMIPVDHLFLSDAAALPAIMVVRHSDGATHFVVAWRQHGRWLQVMDPAIGRRWVPRERFMQEIFHHEMRVPASAWREWASSDDFVKPLRQRLSLLGAPGADAATLLGDAAGEGGWFGYGALDASVRFVQSMIDAGGIARGSEATNLVRTLVDQTRASTEDIFKIIPRSYWSAAPHMLNDAGELELTLRGAVLVRAKGRSTQQRGQRDVVGANDVALSRELVAAAAEEPLKPLATVWQLLKSDGLLGPLALAGAMAIAAAIVVVEMLLFRGLFDIAWALNLPSQRLVALTALAIFVGLLLLVELPVAMESMRLGRHVETRLRMALLEKLPHLGDRYLQSRPVSDMAERSHSIYLTRQVPALGLQLVQTLCDLCFTLIGIVIIDVQSLPLALLISALAIVIPMAVQPFLNERDLRVRNHAGALHVFYLDALLGLVPIRTHGAEQAVRRQHEGLLTEWTRSARGLIRMSVLADGLQSITCIGLAALLLVQHFLRSGGPTGGDLLLVYWTLKLPAIGHSLTGLAHQYPAQRNVLLRLLEPLSAPSEHTAADVSSDALRASDAGATSETAIRPAPVGIRIANGSVVAAGHTILEDLALSIAPGEHVAIVGASGAGKSTLMGLLLGWHRLASGTLLVDGLPLTSEKQERLRRHTAWVDPAIQIWNRPFIENLAYAADDHAIDQVGAALHAADLYGVLEKLPLGLQTYLGEGGALLSGGEGQRVRLGRALAQTNVRLALLDEPFRGLDRAQRARLLGEARKWWKQATLLCVTHDVGETLAFDRVLVIDNGGIVEDGKPAELAARASRYSELLTAENVVRNDMWQGRAWRRLRIDNGRIGKHAPRGRHIATADTTDGRQSTNVAEPANAGESTNAGKSTNAERRRT